MKVSVVNYGIGNLLSVQRAFEKMGADVVFVDSPETILASDRLVVPGVGAFRKCMEALETLQLREALIEFASSGKPYLGICVGMQMLMDVSFEFGEHSGLSLIGGEVRKIDVPGERVPFIGWKEVEMFEQRNTYYFVHSYHASPASDNHLLATYALGASRITAAVKKDNILGVQFHPEKSGVDGLRLIAHFLES